MNNSTLCELNDATDSLTLRRTFGCFPSGVAAVCAQVDNAPLGLLVSSFTSVSLEPPLVSICIMNGSRRWEMLKEAPRLGLSFLGDGQEKECKQLAGPIEKGFDGVEYETTGEGAILVNEATAWLDCSLHQEFDAGDHTIALLRIEALNSRPTLTPLVFHNSQFHRLAAL
ncbi:MAG: flavin reductase family protein [Pseudomonadota bacterium]